MIGGDTMIDLEHELAELKSRVARLEMTIRDLTGDDQDGPLLPKQIPSHENLLLWLKTRGVINELPSEARAIAEQWQALPEAERQAIQQELDQLPAGALASDIIIENRR
jgi:hypothetical protein